MLVCLAGMGMLVSSDFLTDKDYPALDMVKGDIFMIFGASLCVPLPPSPFFVCFEAEADGGIGMGSRTRRRSSSCASARCTRSWASWGCGRRSLMACRRRRWSIMGCGRRRGAGGTVRIPHFLVAIADADDDLFSRSSFCVHRL